MPTIHKQTSKGNDKPSLPPITPKRTSVIDSLPSAWDMADGIKMLVYGRSGTGKTTLWATFSPPILCLVISGGSRPGELKSINTPEYRRSITPRIIQNAEQIPSVLAEAGDYATVVLDHATGLQDLVLKEILGLDSLPAQKSWGMASQQQYGTCTMRCKEYLRALLSLPSNVVIVAQERENNTEGDSELITPTVGAGLTPSLAGWLNSACDYIVQTYIRQKEEIVQTTIGKGDKAKIIEMKQRVKGVEFCLRTAPDAIFVTKFRIPKGHNLPDYIIDPTYDKIYNLINGEVG